MAFGNVESDDQSVLATEIETLQGLLDQVANGLGPADFHPQVMTMSHLEDEIDAYGTEHPEKLSVYWMRNPQGTYRLFIEP